MCLVVLWSGRSCPVSLCLIVSPAALDLYIVLKLLFNFFDNTKKKVQNILGGGLFLVCFFKHVFKFLMVDFLFPACGFCGFRVLVAFVAVGFLAFVNCALLLAFVAFGFLAFCFLALCCNHCADKEYHIN